MNPAWGPEISYWIVAVDFEELIFKGLSHSGIFPHRDVLENISRMKTQYAVRRTCPRITRRRSYQFTHMNRVSGPSHLPLYLPRPCHTLKERQREMTLARREVILLVIQIEDPLPFPGQQLMIGVRRCIPK